MSAALIACLLGPSRLPAAPASAPPPVEKPWMLGPFVKADAVNPILSPQPDAVFDDPMRKKPVAWERDNVFNPAAVVRDRKICILYRAEDDSGEGIGEHTSRIGLAESKDGRHYTAEPTPVLYPAEDSQKQYDWTGGCEDPRAVETPDHGYVMLYTEWDRKTARLAAATSRDLVHWEKHGPVFAKADGGKFLDAWCKSGAIVTRQEGDHLVAARIDGKYWMYWGEGTVCAATSDNLVDWEPVLDSRGDPLPLLRTRPGKFDSALCESGPPAVITKDGIVFLYNGKNAGRDGDPSLREGAYAVGQALFDPRNPAKLLDRTDHDFFRPERPYETSGQYAAGTVFAEGLVHFKKHWYLFYGTADSKVAEAVTP